MKVVLFMLATGGLIYAGGDTSEHVATQLILHKNPSILDGLQGQDRTCSICSKDLLAKMKPVREIRCNDEPHRFHEKCFKPWFAENKTCPKCHGEIVAQEDELKEAKSNRLWAFIYKMFCCKKCTCC